MFGITKRNQIFKKYPRNADPVTLTLPKEMSLKIIRRKNNELHCVLKLLKLFQQLLLHLHGKVKLTR